MCVWSFFWGGGCANEQLDIITITLNYLIYFSYFSLSQSFILSKVDQMLSVMIQMLSPKSKYFHFLGLNCLVKMASPHCSKHFRKFKCNLSMLVFVVSACHLSVSIKIEVWYVIRLMPLDFHWKCLIVLCFNSPQHTGRAHRGRPLPPFRVLHLHRLWS